MYASSCEYSRNGSRNFSLCSRNKSKNQKLMATTKAKSTQKVQKKIGKLFNLYLNFHKVCVRTKAEAYECLGIRVWCWKEELSLMLWNEFLLLTTYFAPATSTSGDAGVLITPFKWKCGSTPRPISYHKIETSSMRTPTLCFFVAQRPACGRFTLMGVTTSYI